MGLCQHRHSFLPLEHCEPGIVLPQYTPKVAGRNSQCLTVNKTLKVSEKSEINRKSCDSGPGIPHSKDPENEAKTRLQVQPQAFRLLLNPDSGPQASERTGHPTSSCPSRAPASAPGLTSSIFTWPPHPPTKSSWPLTGLCLVPWLGSWVSEVKDDAICSYIPHTNPGTSKWSVG